MTNETRLSKLSDTDEIRMDVGEPAPATTDDLSLPAVSDAPGISMDGEFPPSDVSWMLFRSNTDAFILAELVAAERDDRAAKHLLTSAFMHRIQAGWRLLEMKETIKHDGQWREYIRRLAGQLAAQGYVSPSTRKPYSLRYFQEWMFLAKHLPTEQKAQPVAHLGIKKNLAQIRNANARKEYARRVEKGGTVSDLETLVSQGKRYGVILPDPPWEFNICKQESPLRRQLHYDRQTIEQIKTMPVNVLAADNCALFLWAPMPLLPEALEVIAAWGFTFKTVGFVWVKNNKIGDGLFMGMGNYTRANAELCLLATKGNPKRMHADVHQIVLAPVGEHSVKPEEVRKRIERLYGGPYLELYARRDVSGWTTWGNELPCGIL
jgi:N6-adenosine-specific RNA methylase IME4